MVGVKPYTLSLHLHCTGEDGVTVSGEVNVLLAMHLHTVVTGRIGMSWHSMQIMVNARKKVSPMNREKFGRN